MQNIGISEGNHHFIAFGDSDLLHKSHGRAKHAPTALYDSLFVKFQFIGELPLRRSRLGPLFEGAVSVADWGSVVLKIGHSLRLCLTAKPPLCGEVPAAALTVHRTVIHYRVDASLTLREGGKGRCIEITDRQIGI